MGGGFMDEDQAIPFHSCLDRFQRVLQCLSQPSLLSPQSFFLWNSIAMAIAMAAATATTAGMARLLTPSRPSAPSPATSSFLPRPPLLQHHHHHSSTRQLGSRHLAFARNVPAERKSGVAATPAEPEMSAAELRAYQEAVSKLEGTTPDFWEGEAWNTLGFIIQYMWAFGVAVSIIACITAVRTYNLGATDFKNTEVFKEAIEYQVNDAERSAFEESTTQESTTQEAP